MTRGRTLSAVIALACTAAFAAGCGSSDSSSTSSSSSGSTGSTAASTTASTTTPQNVGYVAYSLAAAPQQDMKKGFEAEGKKFGYDVKTVDAQGDAAKANSLMQTFVTQKKNAIIVDSFSADTLQAGIAAAKAANIPVYLGYAPSDTPTIAAAIQANAGTETAQAMVKDVGPKGSVLAFTLPAGPNCVSSEQQFDAVMKANPGWKVQKQPVPVPGWANAASTATSAWLKSHPKGQPAAVWACWDGPGIGAASALAAAGRTDVGVYGQNTEAGSLADLQKKQYAMSYFFDSVALAKRIMDIVKTNAGVPAAQIKHVFERFPGEVVTPENAAEFAKKYPKIAG